MSSRNSPESVRNEPLKLKLERLYSSYNRYEYIDPDPLLFLYEYSKAEDIEIAALIASALAYGRVAQIIKSVRLILSSMTPSPSEFLAKASEKDLSGTFQGFKHRFSTGDDIARILLGAKSAIEKHGSLEKCFLSHARSTDATLVPAIGKFSVELCRFFPARESYLLPSPEKGSACKRVNLMLRWLVRKDEVDVGIWSSVPKSKLVVPLDTHMFRIAGELGLCARNSADLKSALEITRAFAVICPADPVRYDFALTRFGIHPEVNRKSVHD